MQIDHGAWERYTPSELPEDAPAGAMFARRTGDGVDWYDYVRDETSFKPGSVKIAASWRDGVGYVVGPAVTDASMIFPQGCIVVEITDYTGSDPQEELRNKVFDPEAQTFSDPPPQPQPGPTAVEARIISALDGVMDRLARLEKLEKK